ncbi:MAG TPA: hypothetical protein VHH57_01915 [Gaiella sp.]|jgi:hypothetical protein|nr:hypothetical protein [Gaiella sp.]
MKRVDRALLLAASATVGAGLALLVFPVHAALVGHVWLVVLLALGLGAALGRLHRAVPRRPSQFESAFTMTPSPPARPVSLARIEREVTLATGTAFDVHFRLRPVLREIATGLLLRRGLDLERSPDRARSVLGPELWELVRPDRPPPEDRTAPGLPIAAVERAVDDLERLA